MNLLLNQLSIILNFQKKEISKNHAENITINSVIIKIQL